MSQPTAPVVGTAVPPLSYRSLAVLPRMTAFFPLRRWPLSSAFHPLRLTLASAAFVPPGVPDPSAPPPMEVDMVRGWDSVWSSAEAVEEKVVVLWDLDNKPPRGPPYEAAMALRNLAAFFGTVVGVSAFANRHAFLHLPQWVLEQRRERRRLDDLERKGLSLPTDSYACSVCGRVCRTHADLRKHFRQLHERERQKKLARLRSLKGKKRRRYKERYITGNTKYEDAARQLLKPNVGYGLASELRRAGVSVKTVADKPQAADAALKRQVQHSMTRGIDWLFLVSDDSDFSEMLRRAREADLRTIVVGDGRTALSRDADMWFPWMGVENGEVGEEVLIQRRRLDGAETDVALSRGANSDGESDWSELDSMVDEIVLGSSEFQRPRVSVFSEEELTELEYVNDGEGFGNDDLRMSALALPGEELFWDNEDEEDEDL
ncbi:hypothetical protein Taro_019249 [Colocasia esculenta]|uniref:C2H2-type domain-containing protein n=1 Tax=Colocasia esculenta TaxID=4460 RepID=A0A843V4Y6_COLES|nr:hypothetical protein [Colocasia esculenta]